MDTRQDLGAGTDAPHLWWRDWWACDYSWHGLANRPAADGRSLQQAWQEESGQLIIEPGTSRLWTRFHCPFHFADGSPSPKATWSALEWRSVHARLRTRLALADAERPCTLDGMVLDGLDESEDQLDVEVAADLWLSARDVYFTGPVRMRNLRFGLADFTGAWMGGGADFAGSVLAGEALSPQPFAAPVAPTSHVPSNLPQIVHSEPETVVEVPPGPRAKRRLGLWLAAGAAVIGAAAILLIKAL